jgi:hypothetical protein
LLPTANSVHAPCLKHLISVERNQLQTLAFLTTQLHPQGDPFALPGGLFLA